MMRISLSKILRKKVIINILEQEVNSYVNLKGQLVPNICVMSQVRLINFIKRVLSTNHKSRILLM